jgi:hypothetical protein
MQRCEKRGKENVEGLRLGIARRANCPSDVVAVFDVQDCSFTFNARAALSAMITCDVPFVGS